MNTNDSLLYFHFKQHSDQENCPFIFIKPIRTYVAYTIDEVIPTLNNVLNDIAKGFYAGGFLTYESARAFNTSLHTKRKGKMPYVWFGIYEHPILNFPFKEANQFYKVSGWNTKVKREVYEKNILQLKASLNKENVRQVNYTIPLKTEFYGDSFSYFKQLETVQSGKYQAFLHLNNFSILSASPELFFHLEKGKITLRPMKGTIHRGKTYEEDIKNKNWLQQSEKNRYENRIITEMMINELKPIVEQNSIHIKDLYLIEKYPTVYQMTSTIEATLQSNKSLIDIFQTLFPSGSITGYPKEKAMDMIVDFEQEPREIYCGAIGYITPEFKATFNVPIRTVLIDHETNRATFGVGGAIMEESNIDEEYKEIYTKAKLLETTYPKFELLESFGLNDGKYFIFHHHLKRLKQSANYFDFQIDLQMIEKSLQKIAVKYPKGLWKVRLTVKKDGSFSVTVNQIYSDKKFLKVKLAEKAIDRSNIFLYHKTTYREMYDELRKNTDTYDDILLWNEDGEITEFTIGNIVVEKNRELITPPVSSGLLPGTFRKKLLETEQIREEKIFINDLEFCKKIWFINSVQKWIPVRLDH